MSTRSLPDINLQLGDDVEAPDLPPAEEFAAWVSAALAAGRAQHQTGCVTVRIVSVAESGELNKAYRDKSGPTNILAFPAGPALLPEEAAEPELGDLVVCLDVARQEAADQGKALPQHLAHLTVHGSLHLLGHEHQDAAEAAQMEALEGRILGSLGIPDPYQVTSEEPQKNGNN